MTWFQRRPHGWRTFSNTITFGGQSEVDVNQTALCVCACVSLRVPFSLFCLGLKGSQKDNSDLFGVRVPWLSHPYSYSKRGAPVVPIPAPAPMPLTVRALVSRVESLKLASRVGCRLWKFAPSLLGRPFCTKEPVGRNPGISCFENPRLVVVTQMISICFGLAPRI